MSVCMVSRSVTSDSSAIPWTVARQAPLSMEWVAFSAPGDLPDLGIKPASLVSPALGGQVGKD